jgi:rod shape determining protein RodA
VSQFDMISSRRNERGHADFGLLAGLLALGAFGVTMVYSSTKQLLVNAGENPHYYLQHQLIYMFIGLLTMYAVSRIDYRRFEIATTLFYGLIVLSLMGVFVVGSSALGAQRWYNLGIIQIQPSEFTVLVMILAVATYCSRRPEGLVMYDVQRILVMAVVPLVLIALQPDLGTAIILSVSVAAMMVIAGVPPRFMALLGVSAVVATVAAVLFGVLHHYQIARLTAFLSPHSNNSLVEPVIYTVNNAKSAIGAGGVSGSGLFGGLQTTLGYVPEQRTDFIFSAIGEQLGFIGSSLAILLMGFVGYRIFAIARDAKDQFGQLLCAGIFVFFAFSCFENIGMNMGIMPVTGIPLPLVSYGGSSVIVFFIAGGTALSVSRRRMI